MTMCNKPKKTELQYLREKLEQLEGKLDFLADLIVPEIVIRPSRFVEVGTHEVPPDVTRNQSIPVFLDAVDILTSTESMDVKHVCRAVIEMGATHFLVSKTSKDNETFQTHLENIYALKNAQTEPQE